MKTEIELKYYHYLLLLIPFIGVIIWQLKDYRILYTRMERLAEIIFAYHLTVISCLLAYILHK